ncbi:MAG TPA: CorA family divalent cation transporter [Cytophagales bacterium]
MLQKLAEANQFGFEWLDIVDPQPDELHDIAVRYHLHTNAVKDCLQPGHLPKYELIGDKAFIIVRLYTPETTEEEADTIQELTNKVAIFYTDAFVITIHRKALTFIDDLKKDLIDTGKCRGAFHLLNRVVRGSLLTYEAPADQVARELDFYEDQIFIKDKMPPVLKGLYYLKRRTDLVRRMLILTRDVIENIDNPAENNPNTRDTRDLFVRLQTIYDTLSDNTNQLFNIYFSVSSQRTNEVIRVLTIFSVFFMPLTFIAGIYGMNFEFMPELHHKWGYPGVYAFMAVITLGIYLWFKRKGWL